MVHHKCQMNFAFIRIIHIWIINELNQYLIKREVKTYDNNKNNLYMKHV